MSRYKAPYCYKSPARSNRITWDSLGTGGKHDKQVKRTIQQECISSRMCTARSSSVPGDGGVSVTETPPGQRRPVNREPPTHRPPLDKEQTDRDSRTETLLPDRVPLSDRDLPGQRPPSPREQNNTQVRAAKTR